MFESLVNSEGGETEAMGRKIVCPKCNSIVDEKILEERNSENICLICGASLLGDDTSHESPKEKHTYYYYDSGTLTPTLYDHRTPLYTFEAVDMKGAERQLKEVCPNSPLFKTSPTPSIRCPRCFSDSFQFVPRKFSILTGFATNKVDKMCNKCGKRF